jgi:hypothetical protein
MALINCPECNKKISDKSEECIGCGAPRDIFLKVMVDPIVEVVVGDSIPIGVSDTEKGVVEDEEIVFDWKCVKYRSIKITNVILFIILFLIEAGEAQITRASFVNPLPVFITFWISRWIIRYIFTEKRNFRNNEIYYKIGATILVWIFVFLVKLMIGVIILNLAT